MKKVVIITNAPAPYRVAFFKYIQNKDSEYSFHVIYASENRQIGRQWDVPEEELGSHTFLECKVITMHRKYDDKRIVLSMGIARELELQKPDIVICMEYNATILQAVHWCRRKKVPFLSWSDGTANSEKAIGKLQRIFRKYVIHRAAGFISSSTATMKHQISFGAKPELCHKSLLTVDIDKYLMKKEELISEIVTLMGGRAAEQVKFDDITTGASNDIEKATSIARSMVTQYGMSSKFGMMGLETIQSRYLDGRPVLNCGEVTESQIDEEVMAILNDCYKKAVECIETNQTVMDKLAEHLIEKETITGKEFVAIYEEITGEKLKRSGEEKRKEEVKELPQNEEE